MKIHNQYFKIIFLLLFLVLISSTYHSTQPKSLISQEFLPDTNKIRLENTLTSSPEVKSPNTLSVEFTYPNYTLPVNINLTYILEVRIYAIGFNYTNVSATIILDPNHTMDPSLELVNETVQTNSTITYTNNATKEVGFITAGDNATISWKVKPVYYSTEFTNKNVRLVKVEITGLKNGLVEVSPRPYDFQLLEIHYPIMKVSGPFPQEDREGVDYLLNYDQTKELTLIVSNPGYDNLTEVYLAIVREQDDLELGSTSNLAVNCIEINETYVFSFSLRSISKDARNTTVILQINSNVTLSQSITLVISLLPAQKGLIGFNPLEFVLVTLSTFLLAKFVFKRKY